MGVSLAVIRNQGRNVRKPFQPFPSMRGTVQAEICEQVVVGQGPEFYPTADLHILCRRAGGHTAQEMAAIGQAPMQLQRRGARLTQKYAFSSKAEPACKMRMRWRWRALRRAIAHPLQDHQGAGHIRRKDQQVNIPAMLGAKAAIGDLRQGHALDEQARNPGMVECALDRGGFGGGLQVLPWNGFGHGFEIFSNRGRYLRPDTLQPIADKAGHALPFHYAQHGRPIHRHGHRDKNGAIAPLRRPNAAGRHQFELRRQSLRSHTETS